MEDSKNRKHELVTVNGKELQVRCVFPILKNLKLLQERDNQEDSDSLFLYHLCVKSRHTDYFLEDELVIELNKRRFVDEDGEMDNFTREIVVAATPAFSSSRYNDNMRISNVRDLQGGLRKYFPFLFSQ